MQGSKSFNADFTFVRQLDTVDLAHIHFSFMILRKIVQKNASEKRRKKNREFIENTPFIPILAELYDLPEDQLRNYFLLKNAFDIHSHYSYWIVLGIASLP